MNTEKKTRVRDHAKEYAKRKAKKLKEEKLGKKPPVKTDKDDKVLGDIKEAVKSVYGDNATVVDLSKGDSDFDDIIGAYERKLDGDTKGDEDEVEEADIEIENIGEEGAKPVEGSGEPAPKKYEKPVDGDALMMLVSFVFPIAVMVGVKVMSRGKKGGKVDDHQLKPYHEKMLEKLADEAADELLGETKRSTIFIVCLIAVYVSMVMEGLKAAPELVPVKT